MKELLGIGILLVGIFVAKLIVAAMPTTHGASAYLELVLLLLAGAAFLFAIIVWPLWRQRQRGRF